MLNVEELIKKEMLTSPFNKIEKVNLPAKPSGPNPRTKYMLLVGILGAALVGAYFITKHKKENYGTEEN